ncbi:hypothetical protein OsI_32302 [Oryza sativa Indica Group]|uniref:Uncharacterized protein n=2 Tax=Oryza sativa TaxID=4530 RepID=B9G4X6_ORYSJ|nr:hypothetical protein OsI_32302 [Oryza sativa Indica Group]EEE70174.1 hypothetical protein OsJ_30251 [Oryza sativa Japonica Group]
MAGHSDAWKGAIPTCKLASAWTSSSRRRAQGCLPECRWKDGSVDRDFVALPLASMKVPNMATWPPVSRRGGGRTVRQRPRSLALANEDVETSPGSIFWVGPFSTCTLSQK